MTEDLVSVADHRIDELLDFVMRLTGDLHARLSLSGREDELEAVAVGLNWMAEELEARESAAEELERAKDDLIANVSHELRGPIEAVKALSDMLGKREFSPESQHDLIGHICFNAGRLSELLNAFLALQRLESGGECFELRPTQLAPVLERVVACHATQHPEVDFRTSLPRSDLTVRAEPAKLIQILDNLLSNAIKYSPGGGVVQASATVSGRTVTVSVTDQGLGLPHEEKAKLFSKFYRVRDPVRAGIAGTGLGLAITKQLVEAQGGRVWVESPGPGQGSTFHFSLKRSGSPPD